MYHGMHGILCHNLSFLFRIYHILVRIPRDPVVMGASLQLNVTKPLQKYMRHSGNVKLLPGLVLYLVISLIALKMFAS